MNIIHIKVHIMSKLFGRLFSSSLYLDQAHLSDDYEPKLLNIKRYNIMIEENGKSFNYWMILMMLVLKINTNNLLMNMKMRNQNKYKLKKLYYITMQKQK